jgi:type I restriction enzyme R subunit
VTEIEQRVDPNLLYVLKNKLDAFQVYWQQEVDDFAKVFFKPLDKQKEQDEGMAGAARFYFLIKRLSCLK